MIGLPHIIQCDNGTEFTGATADLLQLWSIQVFIIDLNICCLKVCMSRQMA